MPYVYPDNDLSYAGNFLEHDVQDRGAEVPGRIRRIERALDVLFILHADHEQNCSTNADARRRLARRSIRTRRSRPASAALYGPLHGGANEERAARCSSEIGSIDERPGVHRRASRPATSKLMGFGHRVYKNYDPRAKIIKKAVDEVFEVTGTQPAARHRPGARADRAARTSTSSSASSTRTSTSTRASSTRRSASRSRCSPCSSPSAARSGWLAQWQEMLQRPGAEDRPPAADLHRRAHARLRADRAARLSHAARALLRAVRRSRAPRSRGLRRSTGRGRHTLYVTHPGRSCDPSHHRDGRPGRRWICARPPPRRFFGPDPRDHSGGRPAAPPRAPVDVQRDDPQPLLHAEADAQPERSAVPDRRRLRRSRRRAGDRSRSAPRRSSASPAGSATRSVPTRPRRRSSSSTARRAPASAVRWRSPWPTSRSPAASPP